MLEQVLTTDVCLRVMTLWKPNYSIVTRRYGMKDGRPSSLTLIREELNHV